MNPSCSCSLASSCRPSTSWLQEARKGIPGQALSSLFAGTFTADWLQHAHPLA